MSVRTELRTFKDPRLDRQIQFDDRSRAYNVADLWAEARTEQQTLPRSYTWSCDVNLDQGNEGACVGFAWTHEKAAKPRVDRNVTNFLASEFYHRCLQVDEFPGEEDNGTSVLAGAKVAVERQWISEYRWAFGLTDALTALSRHGTVVFGLNWFSEMMRPNSDGFLKPRGQYEGGHAIMGRGVNVRKRFVLLHNSWGSDWGGTEFGPGTAKIDWDDLGMLLEAQGECCVPVVRL